MRRPRSRRPLLPLSSFLAELLSFRPPLLSCRACAVSWRLREGEVVRRVSAALVVSLVRARAALSLPSDPGWDATVPAPGLQGLSADLEGELSSYASRAALVLVCETDRGVGAWLARRLDLLADDLEELWVPSPVSPACASALLVGVDAALSGACVSGPYVLRVALAAYKALPSLEVPLPSHPTSEVTVRPSSGLVPDRVEFLGPGRRFLGAWYVPDPALGLDKAGSEVYDQLRRDGVDPSRAGELASLLAPSLTDP